MAKFTVYFKDKPIHSGIYETGVVHIGRDDSNELIVDSLAVAPIHAVVVIKNGLCVIKQLSDKSPLLVNNQPVKEWTLQHNDVINVGKHNIVYNTTESILTPNNSPASEDPDILALNDKLDLVGKQQEGNLQVMDGPHIGRILPLKKAMTRLGHEGGSVVVISRRKDGYYLSALQGHDNSTINKQPLGDRTVQLQNHDVIEVETTPMQFFLE